MDEKKLLSPVPFLEVDSNSQLAQDNCSNVIEEENIADVKSTESVIKNKDGQYFPYRNSEVCIDIPPLEEQIPDAISTNGNYYTVVQRRGRYYNYKQTNPNDNPYVLHSTQDMARDLYHEAYQLAGKANFRSRLCKYSHIIVSLIIIMGSIGISIASIHTHMNAREYIVAVMGIILAAVESTRHVLKLNKRAITLRKLAASMRHIARAVNHLLITESDAEKLYTKIERYYHKLDENDLRMYDNTLGTVSVKKNTNISYSSTSYSSKKSKKSKES